jgi:hypothetical protein
MRILYESFTQVFAEKQIEYSIIISGMLTVEKLKEEKCLKC